MADPRAGIDRGSELSFRDPGFGGSVEHFANLGAKRTARQ